MKPPIFVKFSDEIELHVFATIAQAEGYFEPIDVQNNSSVAYDAEGRLLRLVITDPPIERRRWWGGSVIDFYGAWQLQPAEDTPTHRDALRNALVNFLVVLRQPEAWATMWPYQRSRRSLVHQEPG